MKSKKLIILICTFFTILAVFFVFKKITVRNVVIAGNKYLTDKEIISILAIKEGSSIIYPSSKSLYERLKKTPWIKDAIIRKDLNGTVTIYIKESTPVAIVIFNGNYYLIDYEAQILEDFTEKIQNEKYFPNSGFKKQKSAIFLPIIKNIDPFKNKETLNEAVKLLNFINHKGFVRVDDEVIITGNNPDDITVYINNFPIIVGKGDFEKKFAKYLVVNAEIQKRDLKVQYIDLRVPDRVIVRPVE